MSFSFATTSCDGVLEVRDSALTDLFKGRPAMVVDHLAHVLGIPLAPDAVELAHDHLRVNEGNAARAIQSAQEDFAETSTGLYRLRAHSQSPYEAWFVNPHIPNVRIIAIELVRPAHVCRRPHRWWLKEFHMHGFHPVDNDRPYGLEFDCTIDARDGSVADLRLPGTTGEFFGVQWSFCIPPGAPVIGVGGVSMLLAP